MSKSVRYLVTLVLLAGLCTVPWFTNGYSQYIANLVLVYVTVGIGFNILLGYAGQFAFASAAFMGIGAYVTAILSSTFGMPVWVCIPAAGLVAMAVGVLCAIPALRVASIYLALVTFAFAELMIWVFHNWKSVTKGANGISVATPEIAGYSFGGDTKVYFLLLPLTLLCFWASSRVLRSSVGRAFVIVRESEIVARCNGIDVPRIKMIAFGLSALFGGLGGAFYAYIVGFILPTSFGLFQLVIHIAVVVIGGMGSLAGPVIGAVLLTVIPELLRDLQSLQEILFGVMLILFPMFLPRGLAGVLARFRPFARRPLIGRVDDISVRPAAAAINPERRLS